MSLNIITFCKIQTPYSVALFVANEGGTAAKLYVVSFPIHILVPHVEFVHLNLMYYEIRYQTTHYWLSETSVVSKTISACYQTQLFLCVC